MSAARWLPWLRTRTPGAIIPVSHIAVFTRFALVSASQSGWRIARRVEDASQYRASLFAPERLEFRLWTLETLALASLERARGRLEAAGSPTQVSYHVLTSQDLPRWALERLEAHAEARDWMTVTPLPPARAYPAAESRLVLHHYFEAGIAVTPTILGSANLDDDDAVADDALLRLDPYIASPFRGMAVTLSTGLVGELDAMGRAYTAFRVLYAPKIALLTTYIVEWVSSASAEGSIGASQTCYALGSHLSIDRRVPVISDASGISWIRSMHSGNDVLQGHAGDHWATHLPLATPFELERCSAPRDLPLAENLQMAVTGDEGSEGRDIMKASKLAASLRGTMVEVAWLRTRRVLEAASSGSLEIAGVTDRIALDARGRITDVEALLHVAGDIQKRVGDAAAARVLEAGLPYLRVGDRRRVRLRLFYLLRDAGDKKGATRHLTNAVGKGSNAVERARKRALAGDGAEALTRFSDAVEGFAGRQAAAIWTSAFAIVYGLKHDHQFDANEADVAASATTPMWAVSGMGWSGSGAVFDYLRDIRGVRALRGESRLIEGKYGLAGLLKANDADTVTAFLRDMLVYVLLGAARCSTYNDYRHARNARKASAGSERLAYAAAALAFVRFMSSSVSARREDIMARFLPLFETAMHSASGAREHETVLLDNVVHVSNLHLASWFPSIEFVVVVRDPRDQYVDNKRQNKNFKLSVDAFCERYERQRESLRTVSEASPNVHVTSFERFVRDEVERSQLAATLGADPRSRRGRNLAFQSKKSVKNIGLFRGADDLRADVDRISTRLANYLYDDSNGH